MSPDQATVERPATVVVHVRETITPALAGHDGLEYESPPQPCAQALTLVRVLLGRTIEPTGDEVCWRCPIAGGQRTVTLRPAPNIEPPTRGRPEAEVEEND